MNTHKSPEQIVVTAQILGTDIDKMRNELINKFPILFIESLANIGLPHVMLFALRVDALLSAAQVVQKIKDAYPRQIWAEENTPYKMARVQ